MASKPYVEMTWAGDSTNLQKAMDRVGAASKDLNADLDRSASEAKRFGSAMDTAGNSMDSAEGKFMGTADLLDGLATTMGLPIGGAIEMSRGFADLASGLKATVIPAMQSMWATLAANPMIAVVAGIAALVAALVLAYQKSETFRNIVNGAFNSVKNVVTSVGSAILGAWDGVWNFFSKLPERLVGLGKTITNVLTAPWRTAFNLIADMWNNTVGKLSFKFPGWVPGLSGKGFDVPDMPKWTAFAEGGIVTQPTMGLVGEAGPEAIIPLRKADQVLGGNTTVNVYVSGSVVTERQLIDSVVAGMRQKQNRTGSLRLI